jgi:hypothetical protein
MYVITSGFPKHGNHALTKAVQLLGVNCSVNHIEYVDGLPEGEKHVFVTRDPRNAVISWLRFTGRPLTQGMFITALGDLDGKPLIDAMAAYEGWLTNPNTLVVRFEDLIASDARMRSIASYLGVQYLDDAFPALLGGTMTWTGALSDYTTLWTPAIDAAWIAAGGPALLARWGY